LPAVARYTGTPPIEVKNQRLKRPSRPDPVKYDDLMRNCTGRTAEVGMITVSSDARWLLASSTGPCAGT
jgi:hypothetical protein